MPRKVCFVPSCNNTTENAPSKIFLSVPVNVERRRKWFSAVKTKQLFHLGHGIFCCEDHFSLEEDAANWMYYKMLGSSIKLKPDVVPHRFISSRPLETPSQSALTDSDKKRKEECLQRLSNEHRNVETVDDAVSSQGQSVSKTLFSDESGIFQVYLVDEPVSSKKSVAIQVNVKNKCKSVQTNSSRVGFVDTATSPVFKKRKQFAQSCITNCSSSSVSDICESERNENLGSSSMFENDTE